MFKNQLTENKMIAITAALVVLMAFPTYQTLAQNDGVETSTEVAVDNTTATQREPASIPASTMKPTKSAPQFQTVNLKCTKKSLLAAKVAGGFIQFQGKNCIPKFKEGDVEIINKRNGFTASIFSRGTDQYQTDLIQLENGDNEIVIRYHEGSGKPVEEIVNITSSSI